MLQWIYIAAGIVYTLYIFVKIARLIFSNGTPAKTIAWIGFILFVPVIGIFIYHLIGINHRKEKTFLEKYTKDQQLIKEQNDSSNRNDLYPVIKENISKNEKLINLLQRNGNSILTYGNAVKILRDGGPKFEAVYAAVKSAQHYIYLEYYIFLDGVVASKLIELLRSKAAAGVFVKIIYDGVGSRLLSDKFIQQIEDAGIHIYPFMPVSYAPVANRINYRNHRKIIVVDGIFGFTGGINVADKYVYGDETLGYWSDTHLQIKGPAVAYLENIFRQDWYFVSGEKLPAGRPNHDPNPNGSAVQIVASGPDSDFASIRHEYFTLINEAEEYIYITTPYFIPGAPIIEALKTAALSGVEVILLLPRNSDSKVLKWSIRSYLPDLMLAGVRVFLYQPGFLHSKTIVADDAVASIGTANVDQRSFDQNFEVNALVYDPIICQELKSLFFKDLVKSKELNLPQFSQRPYREKLMESTARLLSPLL